MARSSSLLLLAPAVLAVLGCGSQGSTATATPTPTPTSTATPTATAAATSPETAAAAEPPATGRLAAPGPAPSALKLAIEIVAVEPTGELPIHREEETVVDPGATFRVKLAGRIVDARLLVLDGADAAVPAKGTREVGESTVLTLAPTSPLTPGSHYQLRVDGDRTRELHDEAGGAHAPFTLPLLVAGTPPPPEPPRKRTRRR